MSGRFSPLFPRPFKGVLGCSIGSSLLYGSGFSSFKCLNWIVVTSVARVVQPKILRCKNYD